MPRGARTATATATPATDSNSSENIRQMTHNLMEILFEKKDVLGDGDYLNCSNLLKTIHDESRRQESRTMRITIQQNESLLPISRELQLRRELIEKQEKLFVTTRTLMYLVDVATRRRENSVPVQRLLQVIRDLTDDNSTDDESSSSDDSDEEENDAEDNHANL
jgi:hypothetical protein